MTEERFAVAKAWLWIGLPLACWWLVAWEAAAAVWLLMITLEITGSDPA